jgi:imidazolonepropionase-like amidohydrolase
MREVAAKCVLAVLCTAMSCLARPAARAAVDPPIAIFNGTIIDGTGHKPLPNGVVVISGGRIQAVGPVADVRLPKGTVKIDAASAYVIPGLMDANVHLLIDIEAENLVRNEGRYDDLIVEAAQLALKHGVTTMFDTWGPREALVRVRQRINSGETVGARIFLAGNIIGLGGPFSSDFLPASTLSQVLVDRINQYWEQGVGADLLWRTPDEVRQRVHEYIERGGLDFLKYASSGHRNEQFIAFSPEAQRAIVAEGHANGLRVLGHSTSVESLRLEIEAGVDVMQHCDITGTEPIPAATLKVIVDRRIACAAMFHTQKHFDWEIAHGGSGDGARKSEVWRQNDRALIESGAVLLRTTDSGVWGPNTTTNPIFLPLKNVPDRSNQLVTAEQLWMQSAQELGMAPMDILLAASRNIAAAYGKLDEIGTIEVGKRADLLILNADPLQDYRNYQDLRAVIKDGRIVDTDHLPTTAILSSPNPAER